MLRGKATELVRLAVRAPVGLHGGEIVALQSLLAAHPALEQRFYSIQRGLRSAQGGIHDASTTALPRWLPHGAALERPPPPLLPPLHRRRYAAAAPPSGGGGQAEEFDLIAPDLGIVTIEGVDDSGFIVSGVQVEGSILACGDLWLQWTPRGLAQVTPECLAPFLDLVRPAPELLVLGCGRRLGAPPAALAAALRERGVALEALDTVNAVATFNILNQEGRKVVGALLPAGAE